MTPLYIVAFDHRTAFTDRLPAASDRASIVNAKRVIYDGFLRAVADGVDPDAAGIIIDEEYGAEIAREARSRGTTFAMPVEVSGKSEFDFAYGDAFEEHLDAFEPTFAKALTRYDADGDPDVNARQAERLARLTAALEHRPTQLMLEALVPDREPRAELIVRAIEALRDAGVEPDLWKVDVLTDASDCAHVVAGCRAGGRPDVGVIVLGRGADERLVASALGAAAATDGYVGFAIGRTIWGQPLERYLSGAADRATAELEIAAAYTRLVGVFTRARTTKTPKPVDLAVLGLRLTDYFTRPHRLSSASVSRARRCS
jgi:myo-inositol catabolism protein IolC